MQSHHLYHHLLLWKCLHRPSTISEVGTFQEQILLLLEQLFRESKRLKVTPSGKWVCKAMEKLLSRSTRESCYLSC